MGGRQVGVRGGGVLNPLVGVNTLCNMLVVEPSSGTGPKFREVFRP
jgi:hypothetical protein